MSLHRAFTMGLAALALAACDGAARKVAESRSGQSCVRCHGGELDDSGAPPRDVLGRSDASLPSVGAHTKHVAAGIDCGACHVKPARSDDGHVDGVARIQWGPLASANGTLTPSLDRSGDAPTYACSSVYCHGAFPGGNAGNAPRWTEPGGAACGSCHALPPAAPHPTVGSALTGCAACHPDTVTPGGELVRGPASAHANGRRDVSGGHGEAWMDPASPEFHAFSADLGLAGCRDCHGADLAGGSSGLGCASCHDGTAAVAWGCVMCHGGVDNQTGAPPRAIWGYAGDPDRGPPGNVADPLRVGAHTRHLSTAMTSPIACETCHVVPQDVLDPAHIDGADALATVTLSGKAVLGGNTNAAWSRTSGTCSSTYCHGGFPMGNATYAPAWADAEADACGTCHGNPAATTLPTALPRTGHPGVATGTTNAVCSACHPETVDATGAIVAGGKHLDGLPQVAAGAQHPDDWTAPSQHGAAAAQDGNACLACHAPTPPATVSTVTCAMCHGGPSWRTTCNGCHGQAGDPRGAPPADVAGNTPTTFVGVGAHRRHVDGSSVSAPIDCVFCHVKPADVFDDGHLDGGTVKVTAYTGADAPWTTVAGDPGWTAGTASCATSYCHGNFDGGNRTNAPIWTAARADACGTCHGLPPGAPHPAVGPDLTGCATCHPDSIDGTGSPMPGPAGAHLNGQVDVTNPHPAGWMATASSEFHALAANRGIESCRSCHGQDLGGGIARACAACHDGTTAAAWGCTTCHGGDENATGAPPKAIWGQGADAVRVGAHTAHVDGVGLAAAIDCGVCHVKPAEVFAPGHVGPTADGETPLASVAFSGIAAGAAPWNRATPTCNVYCHGAGFRAATAGDNTTPDWTGGADEAACGSCHLVPPLAPHTSSTNCGSCHDGYTSTSVNPATHVNGTLQVANLDCFSCHGDRDRPATERIPMLPAAPPVGTQGETQVTDRAVGAHQLHLVGGALSTGFECETCHEVPTAFGGTSGHPSGAVELKPIIGGTGAWDPGSLTCSSTYCHGEFRWGNGANAPVWNAPASDACGTCHGLPPPSPHPASASCGGCHTGYTATTVNLETHVNGSTEASVEGCTGCHGDASRIGVEGADANVAIAPPATATGSSAGAHLVHVNLRVKSVPAQCGDCHSVGVPPPGPHPSGAIDVAFGGRAVTGGAAPSYDQTAGCSATYCHGNYSGVYTFTRYVYADDSYITIPVNYQGAAATPGWSDGPMTCGSCHGNPPPGYWHSATHGGGGGKADCQTCHPDATGSNGSGGATITDPTKHVNGVIDMAPKFGAGCGSGNCHVR